jgi:hypothetical protein
MSFYLMGPFVITTASGCLQVGQSKLRRRLSERFHVTGLHQGGRAAHMTDDGIVGPANIRHSTRFAQGRILGAIEAEDGAMN